MLDRGALWFLSASVLFVLEGRTLSADTIYLKNGNWIDGYVVERTASQVILQIGAIGKIDIAVDAIDRIETNSNYGLAASKPASRRTDLARNEPGSADAASAGEDASGALDAKPHAAGEKSRAKPETSKKSGERRDAVGGKEGAKPGTEELDASPTEDDADDEPTVAAGAPAEADVGVDGGDEAPPTKSAANPLDPKLKARIEALVEDLTRQKANYRVRAERHLRAIGAPAVPLVLPLVKHENELVRVAAFRLLVDFGDESVLDAAIDALADTDANVRDLANRTLRRVTKEDFKFRPLAAPRERTLGRERWRAWWDGEKQLVEQLRASSVKDTASDPDSALEPEVVVEVEEKSESTSAPAGENAGDARADAKPTDKGADPKPTSE